MLTILKHTSFEQDGIEFDLVSTGANRKYKLYALNILLAILVITAFVLLKKYDILGMFKYPILIAAVGTYYLLYKKFLFGTKKIGKVVFKMESMDVYDEKNVFAATLSYNEIKCIKYKGSLKQTISGDTEKIITYLVQFQRYGKEDIFLELDGVPSLSKITKNESMATFYSLEAILKNIPAEETAVLVHRFLSNGQII